MLTLNNLKKMLIVYGIIILFGYILFPAIWGFSGGIVGGNIFSDPLVRSEMVKITGEKQNLDAKEFLDKLPQDKKNSIESLVKEQFKKVNWFPVHLIVNLITFSILGFFAGIILKEYQFAGVIPVGMLFVTLPILMSKDFVIKNVAVTIIISLLAQFVSVYLFSYIGYKIRGVDGMSIKK